MRPTERPLNRRSVGRRLPPTRYAGRVSTRAETTLVWLLRILGGAMLLAVVAIFLPTGTMARINDLLELEPLHRSPLTEYLTRSLSALYALLGAQLLFLSTDLRRYRPYLVFQIWMFLVGGVFMTALDVWAGMPPSWSWTEGPPMVLISIWMLWLMRRVPQS